MKPNTPILMLSLLIPVTEDTSPEQIINIIGQQVFEALTQIRVQQANAQLEAQDPESVGQDEFNATIVQETLEPYSDETRTDILTQLGYTPEAESK